MRLSKVPVLAFFFSFAITLLASCGVNVSDSKIKITKQSYFNTKNRNWDSIPRGEYLDKGFSSIPSKIKLQISQEDLADFNYIEIQNPYLHDIDISSNSDEITFQAVNLPLLGRKTWKINNNKHLTFSIFLDVQSPLKHQVPIKLLNDKEFNFGLFFSTVFSGMYLGILLIIILICLILYIKIGDSDLRNYVLMVLFVFLTQSAVLGMDQIFMQNLFAIRESHLILYASHMSVFGCLYFTSEFLKIKLLHPCYLLIFKLIIMIAGFGLVGAILGFTKLSYQIISINNTFTVVAILLVSGAAWRKGNREGGLMFLAYAIFLLGAVVFALRDLHLLPWSYFTQYCMPFGSGIESIIITFAIGSKMQMIKKSQQQTIEEKNESLVNIIEMKAAYEKLKLYSLELKQKLLGAQIKPHFISNCLNGISALIASRQYSLARGYIVRFGRMMRGALRKNTFDDVLLFEECILLHAYCTMEQFRAENRLQMSIHFDPKINIYRMTVPNLIFQPIVENAIIHGLKHLVDRDPVLNIEIQKGTDYLKIIVDDNGIGRVRSAEINLEKRQNDECTKHESVGIELITERIKLILNKPDFEPLTYVDKYTKDGTPLGTTATLLLPFKEYDFSNPKEGNNPFDSGFIIEDEEYQ